MNAWLTQIIPDERRADVRRDLADVECLHKRIMRLVPDELGADARNLAGLLFRVERRRDGTRLLVQSQLEPNTGRLPPGYGQAEVRKLGPFLEALTAGAAVHYRLTANPSKRAGRTAGQKAGKIVPLRGADADAWWAARAPRCGLALRTLTGTPLDDVTGDRDGRRIRHALTRFDGLATVTDPDALRHAVLHGIGRARSYGAGLLSLAPLRSGA